MIVYIFNKSEIVVSIIDSDEKEIKTLIHHRRINVGSTGDDNYLEIEIPANITQAEYIVEGNYLGFKDEDDNFQMFRIIRYDDLDDAGFLYRNIYAPHIMYELRDSIVEDKKPRDITASIAVAGILSTEAIATRWSTGVVDDFGVRNIDFYYQSAWSCLLAMRERWAYIDEDTNETLYGIINPRVEFTGTSISARYIDFKKEIGEFRGKVFSIDKDIKSIAREVDLSDLATAVYAFGAGKEIEQEEASVDSASSTNTYSKAITIEDEEWIKADSDLSNQDFEDGLTDWSVMAGTIVASEDYANVGTYSAKMSPSSILYSDYVEVTPTIEYNARCLGFVNTTGVQGYIYILWYNSSYTYIGTSDGVYLEPTANTWNLFRVYDEAPSTATYARIGINTLATSSSFLYIDKARFGDYADKPLNQGWIEDEEAKAKWGYAGGTRNIFKKYVNGDTTDTGVLIQQAWWYLQKVKEPKVSYTMDVVDLESIMPEESNKVRIGDTVYIEDLNFNPQLKVSGRINELSRNYLFPEDTQITISNFFEEALDSMVTAEEVSDQNDTTQGVWNKGTLYENTPAGNTRMRLVEVESGEFASQLRYEDDEGNLVGYFNASEFEYNEIYGGSVFSQNIINTTNEEIDVYISSTGDDLNEGTSGSPWKTFNRAIRSIPKILNHDIRINVGAGTYREFVNMEGFGGGGLFEISADSGVELEGNMIITSCSCPIYIHGVGTTGASDYFQVQTDVANFPPFNIYNCQKIRFEYCWGTANNFSGTNCLVADASNVIVDTCVMEQASSTGFGGIVSADMANIYTVDSKGSGNYYGLLSRTASHIGVINTRPLGTAVGKFTDNASTITDTGVATGTASPFIISPPALRYIQTIYATNSGSFNLRNLHFDTTDKTIKQGQISLNAGNNYGMVFFNDATYNMGWFTGKNLFSAILYIKRKIGGIASARRLTMYGHTYLGIPDEGSSNDVVQGTVPTLTTNYGEVASIKWQEELAFYLPQQFLTDVTAGTIDGILFYNSTGQPYVQLDGDDEFDIRIRFVYN